MALFQILGAISKVKYIVSSIRLAISSFRAWRIRRRKVKIAVKYRKAIEQVDRKKAELKTLRTAEERMEFLKNKEKRILKEK